MALILNDRVKETSLTTGVSDFALGGAETGFQSFSAGVGANNTTYYSVTDGTDWEVGLGTLSSDGLTLARTTVLQSSNADAKVNFAAGVKKIFVTYPADKAVLLDAAQTLTNKTIDYANNTLTGVLPTSSIGVTVQGYDANTVVDASYVHTDNNYTTTEKNKLAGIAAGAEVNVNADWNAVSGDAQILNKPTAVSSFTNDAGYITSSDSITGNAATATNADQLDGLDSTDFARYSSGGTINNALASAAWVTAYGGSTNVDHIWHDDTNNVWHFCSDTTFKGTGNAALQAGPITANGIVVSDSPADGTIPTAIKLGRDGAQYVSFYGNASGNRMASVSSSGNPKNFEVRVTDSVNTGIYTFDRLGTFTTSNLAVTGTVSAASATFTGININNGALDGGGVVFSSAGNTNWEIDNSSGALRFFQPGTTYGSWTPSELTLTSNLKTPRVTVSGSSDYLTNTTGLDSWTYSTSALVSGQTTEPRGVFFSTDGTQMYVCSNNNDSIFQYTLSTAWSTPTASYVRSFSVAAQETAPYDVFFKPDGTVMYTVGSAGDAVDRFNLSTAWDISTATFANSFSVSAQESDPQGLFFKSDGTKMYIIGTSGDDVNEYDLSTAWDITTATYVTAYSVAAYASAPQGISFSADGSKFWVVGTTYNRVIQYNMSTPWSIATASFNAVISVFLAGPYVTSGISGIFVNEAENRAYFSDYNTDRIIEFTTNISATAFYGSKFYFYPDTQFKSDLITYGNLRVEKNVYAANGSAYFGTTYVANYYASNAAGTTNLASNLTTGTANLITSQTTGTLNVGGTAATGTLNIGRSTATNTINIGSAVTASGSTQTINFGTSGATGSTTNINIGSPSGSTVSLMGAIQEEVYALTGSALDPKNGTIQTKTLAANTTFTDSLASGQSMVLMLGAGASYTVTFPTITWVTGAGNVAPTLTAADTLVFWKISTTLYGAYAGSYA